MILPPIALIKAPKFEIKDIEVEHLGPRKYILFGERRVLWTERLAGRATISNGLLDFGSNEIVYGTKIPTVQIGETTYHGVTPMHQVDYSTKWWCCIDHIQA